MKHYFDRLDILSQKELEEELKKNKNYPVGGYVVYKPYEKKSSLYKILDRTKNKILLKDVSRYYSSVYTHEVSPLTIDIYKEMQRESLGKGITSIHTVWNYYKDEIYNMYGEKNVDFVKTGDRSAILTIKFPTLTISNEHGIERDFHDVYCIHEIKLLNGRLSKDLKIFRATATVSEYEAGYFLSHVNGDLGQFGHTYKFCTGNDPIIQYLKDIKITDFLYYLLLVENFISTESVEGIPFVRLTDIKEYRIKKSCYEPLKDGEGIILPEVMDYIKNFTYTYDPTIRRISIDKHSIEPAIRQYVMDERLYDCLGVYIGDSHGIPLPHRLPEDYEDNEDIVEAECIEFKGEIIDFELAESTMDLDTNPEDFTVNPSMVDEIASTLETQLSPFITNYLMGKYD